METNLKKTIYTWNGMRNYKANYSDYVVFDLETTGLSPQDCEIIEIGALKYKNNELVDTFSVLIKPINPIPSLITELTGISDDMVVNENDIKIVLPKFIDFIEDLPLVAHNGSFDLSFINANSDRLNLDRINNKNVDTLLLARKYLPNLNNHKLTTLKEYFSLNYGSHRSVEDCMVTNFVYQFCKSEYEKIKLTPSFIFNL